MSTNIAVIGTGYVGLVTGACLAERGMNVVCMDTDRQKVSALENGIVPIYEPGLADIIARNSLKNLKFTSDMEEAVKHAEVIFIAVGTPTLENNTADLRNVFAAASEIARLMPGYRVVVNKSTVPVGTGQRVKEVMRNTLDSLNKQVEFDVVSNPEFLREGSAVKDFNNPDRIVVGTESKRALYFMEKIYKSLIDKDVPFITTNIETAEIIKYASNAFLAAKISFINEIANMCELCGADGITVSKAMGLDGRIGPQFLNPGPGFGGSCFPKDIKAMVGMGKKLGYTPQIVRSTIKTNEKQKKLMLKKIKETMGKLKKKTVTILGTAFKPDTDDIRESPSLYIIKALLDKGAKIKVYDPQAMENTRKSYPGLDLQYCNDEYSACRDSDCIVLATEWKQFSNLDFYRLKTIVHTPVFIDLRNVYQPDYVKNYGFVYRGVGRK